MGWRTDPRRYVAARSGRREGPVADAIPAEVVALARAGNELGAMKLYRQLTGVSGDEARRVVGSI